MSTIFQHRMTTAFGLVLFVLLLLPPGLPAQEEAAAPQTSLAAFETLYAQIGTAAADEIAFGLKTELIRLDAEIEVLKLEAARFDGERQQQALDRLVAAAAHRERRIIDHIRRLEALSGTSAPCVEAAGSDGGRRNGGSRGNGGSRAEGQGQVQGRLRGGGPDRQSRLIAKPSRRSRLIGEA